MINENFVYLGLLINSLGGALYLYYTIKGKVKPNRITWFLWGIIPLVAFLAQKDQGVGLQSLLTFATGFTPLLIFVASFINKEAYWKVGRLDIVCGAFSVLGLFLWILTGLGNIAIFFSLIADGMAAVPTIVKAYKNPETESGLVFLTGSIGAGVTALTIKEWNFATYSFPFYIFAVNLFIATLVIFKIGKRFGNDKLKVL